MKTWNRGRCPLLFLLIVSGIMFFFADIGHGPWIAARELFGLAHLAFFAILAWLLSTWPVVARRRFHVQCYFIIAVVFLAGGCIEVIQPHFGRSASWRDMGINTLGGLIGVMFLAPARRCLGRKVLMLSKITVIALVMIVFYVPFITLWDIWQASRQFPVLSDFETPFEARRWSSGEITSAMARHGRRSLRVSMGTEKYAGTSLYRISGDWRGYTSLNFCLYNPDADFLRITVSIRDEEHSKRGGEYFDRFNRVFAMKQGWNEVQIPIADIENAPSARSMDLSRLSEVVIFTVDPPAPRLMYLDYVRLVR